MRSLSLTVFMVLCAFGRTQSQCSCPVNCLCQADIVTCTNLQSMPSCFPSGTSQVFIKDSPNLHSLEFPTTSSLNTLSINNVGLIKINEDSNIRNLTNLKRLEITECGSLKKIDLGKPSQCHNLETLSITHCHMLSKLDDIDKYSNLITVNISLCALQNIDDDLFDGLVKLKYLDLSHNHLLDKIDKDAFETLDSLEELYLTDCALETLYPDYFDNSYHRNLKYVNTLINPLQCFRLCDFWRWFYDDHENFAKYAYIGGCYISTYSTVYVSSVWNLDRYEAGCPTAIGIIIGATIGAFFLLCILSCLALILCGIDWRKYLCCCCESQRNRNASSNNQQAVSYGAAQAQVTTYAIPDVEKTYDVAQPMYQAAPPSYEDLVQAAKMEDNTNTPNEQTVTVTSEA